MFKVKNTPYVKEYKNGVLTNPITKEEPYISGASTKQRSKMRGANNRKGNGLVVTRLGAYAFLKYTQVKQYFNGKVVTHSILKE